MKIDSNIDFHKDQFSVEIAEAIMDRLNGPGLIGGATQLKAQIQLLILDAVEFGIQLGGMEWKENEK